MELRAGPLRSVISKQCRIDVDLAISISFPKCFDVETNLISHWGNVQNIVFFDQNIVFFNYAKIVDLTPI